MFEYFDVLTAWNNVVNCNSIMVTLNSIIWNKSSIRSGNVTYSS